MFLDKEVGSSSLPTRFSNHLLSPPLDPLSRQIPIDP